MDLSQLDITNKPATYSVSLTSQQPAVAETVETINILWSRARAFTCVSSSIVGALYSACTIFSLPRKLACLLFVCLSVCLFACLFIVYMQLCDIVEKGLLACVIVYTALHSRSLKTGGSRRITRLYGCHPTIPALVSHVVLLKGVGRVNLTIAPPIQSVRSTNGDAPKSTRMYTHTYICTCKLWLKLYQHILCSGSHQVTNDAMMY